MKAYAQDVETAELLAELLGNRLRTNAEVLRLGELRSTVVFYPALEEDAVSY